LSLVFEIFKTCFSFLINGFLFSDSAEAVTLSAVCTNVAKPHKVTKAQHKANLTLFLLQNVLAFFHIHEIHSAGLNIPHKS